MPTKKKVVFHLKEEVLVFETSPSLFPQLRWEGNLAHGHQSELVDLDQDEELLQVSGEDVGLEEEEEQDEEDDFHEERVYLTHHWDRVLAVSGLHDVRLLFFVFKIKKKFLYVNAEHSKKETKFVSVIRKS